MAKAKRDPGTLVRIVTRAISDKSKVLFTARLDATSARSFALTAMLAVSRGKKRGCK